MRDERLLDLNRGVTRRQRSTDGRSSARPMALDGVQLATRDDDLTTASGKPPNEPLLCRAHRVPLLLD